MILEIVRHTPLWVFALFAGLVWLGVSRLRASDIPTGRLFALPVAMTALSLFGLWQAFGANVVTFGAWLVVFALMLAIGATLPRNASVQYSSASKRIHVPGSWLPLALMMTIFLLRYAVAVTLALHPALRLETPFVAAIAAVYGLSSGAFAARAINTWRSAFGGGVAMTAAA